MYYWSYIVTNLCRALNISLIHLFIVTGLNMWYPLLVGLRDLLYNWSICAFPKNALWIRMTLGIKFDLLLTDYLLFIYLLLSSNCIKVRQDLENGEFWFAHLILYFYVVCCENKCSFRKCHLFSYKPTVNSKKCTYIRPPFPREFSHIWLYLVCLSVPTSWYTS